MGSRPFLEGGGRLGDWRWRACERERSEGYHGTSECWIAWKGIRDKHVKIVNKHKICKHVKNLSHCVLIYPKKFGFVCDVLS